jgi:hypothetical protein
MLGLLLLLGAGVVAVKAAQARTAEGGGITTGESEGSQAARGVRPGASFGRPTPNGGIGVVPATNMYVALAGAPPAQGGSISVGSMADGIAAAAPPAPIAGPQPNEGTSSGASSGEAPTGYPASPGVSTGTGASEIAVTPRTYVPMTSTVRMRLANPTGDDLSTREVY